MFVAEAGYLVSKAPQSVFVIVPDGGFIFDDGDMSRHDSSRALAPISMTSSYGSGGPE
jgi:hypothetical protein